MEIANVTFRPTVADFTELFAKLVEQSLSLWDVPEDARVRLINVSENTTYLVDASQGNKAILRVRGQNTYIARHRK